METGKSECDNALEKLAKVIDQAKKGPLSRMNSDEIKDWLEATNPLDMEENNARGFYKKEGPSGSTVDMPYKEMGLA